MKNTGTAAAWLHELETQLEGQLSFTLSVLQNLDEPTLLREAANGGWSISQCLWHLNSYGDFYLPHIKTALEKAVKGSADFRSGWLGALFIRMMQPGKGKYKAFKDHVPPHKPDARQVLATFIQQQEELLYLLKQAKGVDINRIYIPISISKWVKLKLGDVFGFLLAHNERHLQQAKRNL